MSAARLKYDRTVHLGEIRRCEKAIRIFPGVQSVWRLIGALCAEQHEELSTVRLYLNMDE